MKYADNLHLSGAENRVGSVRLLQRQLRKDHKYSLLYLESKYTTQLVIFIFG